MYSKNSVKLSVIFIFCFALFAFAPSSKSYTYVDGNNNVYTLTPDSLVYDPITPNESSSGEYSGGEPKTVKITSEKFSKIEGIVLAILKDKKSHEKNRQMGFGTLEVGKKLIYINSSSVLKSDLENELKLCLQ